MRCDMVSLYETTNTLQIRGDHVGTLLRFREHSWANVLRQHIDLEQILRRCCFGRRACWQRWQRQDRDCSILCAIMVGSANRVARDQLALQLATHRDNARCYRT
jgi:hypothetical protein